MNARDLLPLVNSPSELIENLGRAERERRHDLRDAVASLTSHEDPLVREQAIGLLLFTWKDVPSRWIAVRALEADSDFGVRGQAAFGLIGVSSERTRAEDTRLLIRRLLDEDEELDTRRSVYDALLLLYGRRDFPATKRGLDLSREVDWEWIRELREQVDPEP